MMEPIPRQGQRGITVSDAVRWLRLYLREDRELRERLGRVPLFSREFLRLCEDNKKAQDLFDMIVKCMNLREKVGKQ